MATRKVYLHGHLGEAFGPVHQIEVATAGEALRAFKANFKGFLSALETGSYEVVRGDPKTGHALDVEDINEFKIGDKADLHFIPVVEGAKRGGILKAILGTVLIGAALFFSGGALAAPALGGMLGGVTWGTVAFMGLGLALAGVSQMLTPTDKKEEAKKDESYSLSGALNTYEQGQPVPLIYGEVITGGAVISAGIDIEQLKKDV